MKSNISNIVASAERLSLSEYRNLLREELGVTLQELGAVKQASDNKAEDFVGSENGVAIDTESELLVENYISSSSFSEQDYHRFIELLPYISEGTKNRLRSKIAQAINEQQIDDNQQYELLF